MEEALKKGRKEEEDEDGAEEEAEGGETALGALN